MAMTWGIVLAVLTWALGAWSGMGRDRAFYPTVTLVVAHYYLLFASQDGRTAVLLEELAIASVFMALALAAYLRQPWLVVPALAGHGLMDLVHGHVVQDAGVPASWPVFCSTYDLVAAALVAWSLRATQRPRW